VDRTNPMVHDTGRHSALLAAAAVSLVCWALLLATSPELALVWDEGDTIARAESLAHAAEGGLGQFVAAARSGDAWPYTIVREGHPPLAGLLIALGSSVAPSWLGPITIARFGPITWFALGVGAMFYRLQREYQVWAVSLMAVAALLMMPRVFAHAHYATLDGPLTAAWLLTWAAFAPACRDWRWSLPFGMALGLAFCAKFTGWLIVLPLLAWALLYRDRRALGALALGLPVAVVVFVALNPPLWQAPLEGLRTFFELNLHRSARPELNISTQFFGRMYNLDHPLPWYNALVWTAITISPMAFLMGCVGLVATLRRWRSDRAAMLLVLSWASLIVARALPWAPPHDAERLILPSFAFFAALIGVGIGRALYRDTLLLNEKIPAQGWAKVAMTLALAAPAFDSIAYFPHGLSYYNRLIGGLRGAAALGMEPTYYWDALDRGALAWLNEHTAPGESIALGAAPPQNLALLAQWGMLVPPVGDPLAARWYVIQRRPSALAPADQWLTEHAEPAFERSLSGVPLLSIYSGEQYSGALEAIRSAAP